MIKNIGNTPSCRYSHHCCDYIELLSLINNEDTISVSDIYDRFYEDGKIKSDENTSSDLGSDSSEVNDTWNSKIEEWFDSLEQRASCYKKFYPFIVKSRTIVLKNDLSDKHKAYIFLLLCSSLSFINNFNQLTSDFEELSLYAFKNFLPQNSKVYRFGKSMLEERYKGHISQKIDSLANDLKYRTKYEKDYFSSNDTGDGGLDIVSWTPFDNDENQNSIQVYLGQCATGKEWYKKQDDTDKFPDNFIEFRSTPSSVMFIPYDGRGINRKYEEAKEMKKHLLFDRIRLLNLIDDNDNKELIKKLDSFEKVVDEVIRFEEGLV